MGNRVSRSDGDCQQGERNIPVTIHARQQHESRYDLSAFKGKSLFLKVILVGDSQYVIDTLFSYVSEQERRPS